jgi:ribosome-associated protein
MAKQTLKSIVEKLLEAKQAEAIKIYDVRGQSPLTDYVFVCSINNSRKMDAIVSQLRKDFLHHPTYKLHHIEGKPESGWMVVDLYDVIVHLLDPSIREKMNIETLLEQQVRK